ncbi:DUF2306 domain-containing protein [Nonomuraea rhizosphaerae]|uniref:DUF2306 domain-containing protein n=1 Tax=Nonomuraea rhizosphaerae TaxID=2665663 RepID=UPI001C6016C5|nr:DUF2306 domain-containing protein [Nonomuraea rhizosphaerae]
MTSTNRRGWLVPAGLVLLSVVPVAAGAIRLNELTGGADVTPANARFFAMPAPVVVHIVTVSVFSVLGAFQFAPRFRRRKPGWHRAAGRVLVVSGLGAGLSGLWMTVFYPLAEGEHVLLTGLRLVFGTAMVASIARAFVAIRRQDVARHRAWMTRGYAIGIGAGTQAVFLGVGLSILGTSSGIVRALLMGAAWVINLAVAEWRIRAGLSRKADPRRLSRA